MANKIAEAFIELKVRGKRAAVKAIDEVKQSAGSMGGKFDAALGSLGAKMDKATEGARKLQGAIAGILGIATLVAAAFYKLGNAIFSATQYFRSAKKRVEEFRNELSASGKDLSQQASAVRDRYNELTSELEKGVPSFFQKRYISELKELNKLLVEISFTERARSQRSFDKILQEERAITEERNRQLRAIIEQSAVQLETDPISKIQLRNAQQQRDIQNELLNVAKELQEAMSDPANDTVRINMLREQRRLLEIQLQMVNKIAQQEIKGIENAEARRREEIEKRRRAEREAAEENARVIAEANAKAMQDLQREFANTISSINSQAGAFVRVEDLVASIADEVRQIRGRS